MARSSIGQDTSLSRMKAGFDSPSGYKIFTNMSNKYNENWKESWNPEDWQGRSKTQVGYSSIVLGITITVFLVYGLTLLFS